MLFINNNILPFLFLFTFSEIVLKFLYFFEFSILIIFLNKWLKKLEIKTYKNYFSISFIYQHFILPIL